VRAEIAGPHTHRAPVRQRTRGGEHPQLRHFFQPISRFDLDGGDALAEQRVEPRQRAFDQ
jgi:hypothetical protein